jgi:hypothetical protein
MYPIAADAKSDLVDGKQIKVTLYTVMAGPPKGQAVQVCLNGGAKGGGLRCDITSIPTGGTAASGGIAAPSVRGCCPLHEPLCEKGKDGTEVMIPQRRIAICLFVAKTHV